MAYIEKKNELAQDDHSHNASSYSQCPASRSAMAVRAAPGHIGLTQEIIDHLGGATGSPGYLWSRCTTLVAFDDFFVAQGQPFTFAGAAFAALANCLPGRTNDG